MLRILISYNDIFETPTRQILADNMSRKDSMIYDIQNMSDEDIVRDMDTFISKICKYHPTNQYQDTLRDKGNDNDNDHDNGNNGNSTGYVKTVKTVKTPKLSQAKSSKPSPWRETNRVRRQIIWSNIQEQNIDKSIASLTLNMSQETFANMLLANGRVELCDILGYRGNYMVYSFVDALGTKEHIPKILERGLYPSYRSHQDVKQKVLEVLDKDGTIVDKIELRTSMANN